MGLRRFLCSCCTSEGRKKEPSFAANTSEPAAQPEGQELKQTDTPSPTLKQGESKPVSAKPKEAGAKAAPVGEVGDAEFMKQVLEVADQLVERKIMTQLLTQLTEGPPCSEFVTALAGAMREVYVTPLFLRLRDTVAKGANEQTRKEAEECSTLIATAVIEATLKKHSFYNADSKPTKATIKEVKDNETDAPAAETKKETETPAVPEAKQTPAKMTPAKETPAKETPAKETPVEVTPVEVTPVEETAAKETAVTKATAVVKEETTPSVKETEVDEEEEGEWTDEEGPVKIEEVPVSPVGERVDEETSEERDSSSSSSSSSAAVDAGAVQTAVDSVISSLGGQVSK